jgi:hypothetical protein
MEIGFLILGLIALRPSLVTDLAAMGRTNSERYPIRPLFLTDDDRAGYRTGSSNAIGLSSYYPNWDVSPTQPYSPYFNPGIDPRLGNYPASNVAWPNAQVHQWVHNGNVAPGAAPLMASPTWNNTVPTGRY